jgi:hypothetical protein
VSGRRLEAATALAALGVAGVGSALVLVVAPGVGERVGVGALAEARILAEGDDRAFWLVAVGVCCLLWVARTAESGPAADDLPDVGQATDEVPTVGREFDAAVEAAADAAAEGAAHDDARKTLQRLATDVLVHAEGRSREEAAERVRRGEWTDDPVAAAYLAASERAPLRWRLRAWFRPRRTATQRVRRTVAAIEARMNGGER